MSIFAKAYCKLPKEVEKGVEIVKCEKTGVHEYENILNNWRGIKSPQIN